MWDFDHRLLPETLNAFFIRRSDVHSINLRNSANDPLYTATRRNTNFRSKSFSQYGSSLLNDMKTMNFYDESTTKKAFLKKYKDTFFANY